MSDATQTPVKDSASGQDFVPCIDRTMSIQEIIALLPQSVEILSAYGLHCFNCSVGGTESLQDGCRLHGFDDDTIDALVTDLNEAICTQPLRPQELVVTEAAAHAIADIAKGEGKEAEGLTVIAEADGSFCMEFQPEPAADDHVFSHEAVPAVRIFASNLTLWRIGGATIDFREERFKLDLPDDVVQACACDSNCSCQTQ